MFLIRGGFFSAETRCMHRMCNNYVTYEYSLTPLGGKMNHHLRCRWDKNLDDSAPSK